MVDRYIQRVASRTELTGNGWSIPLYGGKRVHVQENGKVTSLTRKPVDEFDLGEARSVILALGFKSVAKRMADPLGRG